MILTKLFCIFTEAEIRCTYYDQMKVHHQLGMDVIEVGRKVVTKVFQE